MTSAVEVIFWQHPSEMNHPKGTLPLLKACLPNSQVVCTETLTREEFDTVLDRSCPKRQLQLLFPSSDGHPPPSMPPLETRPTHISLLVLDGTWRKARKLAHLNPWLLHLPRRSLSGGIDSRYLIRKAEKAGQLSTLEATCAALGQIESDPRLTQPILTAFDQYMNQLNRFRPPR